VSAGPQEFVEHRLRAVRSTVSSEQFAAEPGVPWLKTTREFAEIGRFPGCRKIGGWTLFENGRLDRWETSRRLIPDPVAGSPCVFTNSVGLA
jgi:hypothetical protein